MKSFKHKLDQCTIVKAWMLTLLEINCKPPNATVQSAMFELWKSRDVASEPMHKKIVRVWGAILEFRIVQDRFTPYYFENQDELAALWKEVQSRVREINLKT